MIEEIKNIKGGKKDIRNFGIIIGAILIAIAGLLFWKEKDSFKIWIVIGSVLLVVGLIRPFILKPVYWVWMVFAALLGWLMTRVILSLFFYLIFTPIGLISRMFGKQFLELKWDKKNSTYWNYRPSESHEKEKYEKQF